MKCRSTPFAFLVLVLSFLSACKKSDDYTGFWKRNGTDAFGVQIKKQAGNLYSVSFCGPGGCFAPGEWTPNTTIVGDPKYRVIDANTIEIGVGQNWTRYSKCTTDVNPRLDYSTMPASKDIVAAYESAQQDRQKALAQAQPDPHRPPCKSIACKKAEAYLKKNFCGESPAGNGPDDGCEVRDARKRSETARVIADYSCEWNEAKNESECKQNGQVSTELRNTLIRQLEKLGMPAKAPGEIYFTIMQPNHADWLAVEAYYLHSEGLRIQLCEVIAIVDPNKEVTVFRKLPWKETDSDVPDATTWILLDIADTRNSGKSDIILEGDAYEDHWFEVVTLEDGSAKTIFSGLGYYL